MLCFGKNIVFEDLCFKNIVPQNVKVSFRKSLILARVSVLQLDILQAVDWQPSKWPAIFNNLFFPPSSMFLMERLLFKQALAWGICSAGHY